MNSPDRVTVDAPAKINLGLEILGKRADGYHELKSVMAMIELADTLTIFRDEGGACPAVEGVPVEENLIGRALLAFREAAPQSPRLGWDITKRIPIAAGLGGASTDAAAALVAANALSGHPLTDADLADVAGRLGSDVPFFLGSPLALSTGRGIELESLSAATFDLLLLIPKAALAQKTKTLYSLIRESDYSDGSRSVAVVHSLAAGRSPTSAELGNSFDRPLASILPEIRRVPEFLEGQGCASYGLSGAGPSHYLLLDSPTETGIQHSLHDRFGDWLTIIPTRTRTHGITVTPGRSND